MTPLDPKNDLGLGGKLADTATTRLLNPDGTFNVRRLGLPKWHPVNLYHTLIELKPSALLGLSFLGYLVLNLIFATLYYLAGEGAINFQDHSHIGRFESCFYFSVQTIGTIGYGRMVPISRAANLLVAIEALIGLIGFAMLSALIYARFTRPRAALVFSRHAIISPYRDAWALMVRTANRRHSNLIDARAKLTLSRWVTNPNGARRRQFDVLELERPSIVFMPLHWVLVHPINNSSPLSGLTQEEFLASEPEFFTLITADEETFAMTVHARTSYRREEIIWGGKFSDMYIPHPRHTIVDLNQIDSYTPVPGPARL